jgi:hypothetical protein
MEVRMPGTVKWILRIEAVAVLAVVVGAYARGNHGWGRFAALFLVPDLSLLAYLGGARAGAAAYNVAHSYLGPLALLAAAFGPAPALLPYALIWLAHCAMDRALGYGLKYATGFRDTHLGKIGRDRRPITAAAA